MNAEQLLAYYDRFANAPDAVTRLRRFLLDLAVRGKLVPQDPDDEPALELLKRIAAEKARLVKAGEIKKLKVLPKLSTADIPFELPNGWVLSRIGEICSKTGSGCTPRGGKSAYQKSGAVFLRSQNIYSDGLRLDEVAYISSATHERMSGTKVKPFDLLLNITGGSIGRCCQVPQDIGDANVSQHVSIIRVAIDGLQDFVHRLILSPFFQSYVLREQTGAGRGGLQKNRMDLIPVPLPPLAEQRRIVARVDELMALCDRFEAAREKRETMRNRLAAASLARLNAPDPDAENFADHTRFTLDNFASFTIRPDQINALRQTILNLAVRGKLVPQDPNDESTLLLLSRLKKDKSAKFTSEGLRARKPVQQTTRGDLGFDIPESWALPCFDDLFVIVSGVTKGQRLPPDDRVEVPYLRVANVQRGFLDLTVLKTILTRKADTERYRLRRGDILMTEGGDWDKLGRTAVWDEEVALCIHQNHVFRVRPPSEEIQPKWVAIYTNSILGRSYFEDASKQTTNLASINMTQLRSCPMPLPPLAEQHRIVAKVDELMALCDRLETSLATGDNTRRRLLEAVLHAALAGDAVNEAA